MKNSKNEGKLLNQGGCMVKTSLIRGIFDQPYTSGQFFMGAKLFILTPLMLLKIVLIKNNLFWLCVKL